MKHELDIWTSLEDQRQRGILAQLFLSQEQSSTLPFEIVGHEALVFNFLVEYE